MDTKWKSIRKVVSFIVFFLGVTLTLWNLPGMFQRMPGKLFSGTGAAAFEEDYQQGRSFRQYISNCLENFLSIAINGCPTYWSYYNQYSSEYSSGEAGSRIEQEISRVMENSQVTEGTALAADAAENRWYGEYGWYDWNEWEEEQEEGLTEEEKARLQRRKEKLIRNYFSGMEEDKNLLYSISYDGKLLYSNADLILADGSVQIPEGYNFLLYFDGESVRITKDGKDVDIYGDGYWREENDWYVPGYRNFPVNDEMKKAVICMAAAKEPALYTVGLEKNGGYRQQNNALYWMQYNLRAERQLLRWNMFGFAAGLGLLICSFFCRRGRREAADKIAALQGKIWIECKVLLGVMVLGALLTGMWRRSWEYGGYDVWWEFTQIYAYEGLEAAGEYIKWMLSDLLYVPAICWVTLFWMIYLLGNDLRHNKKMWTRGLIARCCRNFSTRELKLPLARRMAHRSAILFIVVTLFSIILLAAAAGFIEENGRRNYSGADMILVPYCLAVTGILLTAYLVGMKNVRAAREVDTLSKRIGEICSGDYTAKEGEADNSVSGNCTGQEKNRLCRRNESEMALGKDLETARVQLENIRQGMAGAVDEQMKSERMKVELIANVSHDLKTPLTSIISYVQFLKEEEGLPDHVKDYVKILDEKSQRLKNMVQDVFAVSKAASGELPVNMEELDFGKLLRQTLADMDEEIQGSSLSFRTEIPEAPVMILADGQRMYRVFQNLFQNALKYSLKGSRVYVTLKADGKMAVASVKNTSHMELDEDKNFTERFFRGDKSRTDGGSGLGLSIAQSFTEACGGQFELEFNADLFIVTVSFRTDHA